MRDSGSVKFSLNFHLLSESSTKLVIRLSAPEPTLLAEISPVRPFSPGLKIERGREIEGFTDFTCLNTPTNFICGI